MMSIAIATAGLHPTTEACLEALQWLQERAQCANILEIGCGNGILALAAASIWDTQVLAADISEKAVADTIENINKYQMESKVTAIRSDGFGHRLIAQRAPYGLIICNLLAKTLVSIAADLKKHSAPGGYVLMSGALSWLGADTETAYKALGFEIIKKTSFHNWNSYVLCHKADT
jgi:ribosomal protein L11 methyltransferase